MSKQRKYVSFVAMSLFFLLASIEGFAAVTQYNAIFFKPAIGRDPYFMLYGTRNLFQFQFQFETLGTYSYRPLQVTQNGVRLQGAIDQELSFHPSLAFGIFDFLQFGASLPVYVLNKFQDPTVVPGPGTSNKSSLGDLRLEAKLRFLDLSKNRIGLALIPFVTVPTGKENYYIADTTVTGGAKVALDVDPIYRLRLTLNAGYLGGKRVVVQGVNLQHRILAGAGATYLATRDLSLFLEANMSSDTRDFLQDKKSTPVELLGGVVHDVGQSGFRIRAGGGTCLTCGVGSGKVRAVVAASYRYNRGDYRQRDVSWRGARDAHFGHATTSESFYELRNRCPADPAQFDPGKHDETCNKFYELQNLSEVYFRCPPPEKFNPKKHNAACEKVFTLQGTYTQEEMVNIVTLSTVAMSQRCPSNPDEFNPKIHDAGCPRYYDLSRVISSALEKNCPASFKEYQKGVHDEACPQYYALKGSYEENQWALMVRLAKQDSDGDGIADFKDQCPNQKGNADGCPDQKGVSVASGEIQTVKPVSFDFDSVMLRAPAMEVLDSVTEFLDKNTWITRVEVQGHTDDIGSGIINRVISRLRAERVIDYLKRRQVRNDVKFVAKPYGARDPVVPNTSDRNRAKNRRVVFRILN